MSDAAMHRAGRSRLRLFLRWLATDRRGALSLAVLTLMILGARALDCALFTDAAGFRGDVRAAVEQALAWRR
jgi:hypothetical protein